MARKLRELETPPGAGRMGNESVAMGGLRALVRRPDVPGTVDGSR